MTELPALRAVLHDAAERRYGRRGRRRGVFAAARLVAVAGAVLVVVYAASNLGPASPGGEVEATVTPQPTAAPLSMEIIRTAPIDLAGVQDLPAASDIVRGAGRSAVVERAWTAPELGGRIYLVHAGDRWCLSVPDREADYPDIERGHTCTDAALFERFGISVMFAGSYIAALPDGAPPPMLRSADGSESTLRPSAGLVALQSLPKGSAITLTARDGSRRTDTIPSLDSLPPVLPPG